MSPASRDRPSGELGALALVFLRLGCTAFGGPAAHIALMEREVVRRRGWLTPERFLDLLGAANLIPGPSSSELAIYIGYERAGVPGLLVAGACFILPASVMTGLIAWGYQRYGALPRVGDALYGVKPVIIAVVAQALYRLAPKALKLGATPKPTNSAHLAVIGALATAGAALGVEPIAVLAGAGALSLVARRGAPPPVASALLPFVQHARTAFGATAPASLLGLLLVFLKFGATVFGSGYVLLAFLRADLVDRLHWLTERELLDAVAVGQITPGPVFTTATFIGYLKGGVAGAAVATLGIFLPGFVFVASSGPLVARVRRSPAAAAILDGVNVAAVALMVVVTWQLGRAAIVDVPTAAAALVSAALLVRFDVNPVWLLLGGAGLGIAAAALR